MYKNSVITKQPQIENNNNINYCEDLCCIMGAYCEIYNNCDNTKGGELGKSLLKIFCCCGLLPLVVQIIGMPITTIITLGKCCTAHNKDIENNI